VLLQAKLVLQNSAKASSQQMTTYNMTATAVHLQLAVKQKQTTLGRS
jgi:hypothetical protein